MSPAILTIIIFFLCILSFIWEKIPLAVTCLLGGIALALFGIIDYVDIYSNMGTQVVLSLIHIYWMLLSRSWGVTSKTRSFT